MRNLKKFLALVLAMMMTLSLMVTVNAATPTDFSDGDKITDAYKEAVDVLSALKVVKGDDRGFRPGETITRAEVSAILYRIVTGDVDDKNAELYKGANYFTDVTADRWYDGYVNYCANNGLVLGVGGGKFNPNAPVTGYEALVMILRAIGYNNPKEFSSGDWKLKASGYGRRLGITDNIAEARLAGAATREMVAEIMFQGLEVPTVKYTILNDYQNIRWPENYPNGNARLEDLLLRVFGIEGKSSTPVRDKWGNPSIRWIKWSDWSTAIEIPIAPVDTFYTAMDECTVVEKLNEGEDIDVTNEFLNGRAVERTNTNSKGEIIGTRTLDALHTTNDFVGAQGRKTMVYNYTIKAYNTSNAYWDIVYIDTYLGEVKAKTPATLDTNGHTMHKATLSIEVGTYDGSDADHPYAMLTSDKNFDDYNVGDVLLLNTWSPSAKSATTASVAAENAGGDKFTIDLDWTDLAAADALTVARLTTKASAQPAMADIANTGLAGVGIAVKDASGANVTLAGNETYTIVYNGNNYPKGTYTVTVDADPDNGATITYDSAADGADPIPHATHDFDTDKFEIVSKATEKTVTISGTTGAADDKTGIYVGNETIMANVVYHMHQHTSTADAVAANNSTPTTAADFYNRIVNEQIGKTYRLWLDGQGNILGMKPAVAAGVGVVLSVEGVRVASGQYALEATLLMEDESTLTAMFLDDGTAGSLHQFFNSATDAENNYADGSDVLGGTLKFAKNALVEIEPYTKYGKTFYQVKDGDAAYTKAKPGTTVTDGTNNNTVHTGVSNTLTGAATHRVNGDTVFFVAYKDFQYNWGTGNTGGNDDIIWKVIRDFRDIPTINGEATDKIVMQTLDETDNVAKYAAITSEDFTGANVYDMTGKTPVAVDDSYLIIKPIGTYARYSEYAVMHNGVKETLKVANLNGGVNTNVETALASGQLVTVSGWNMENAAINVAFVGNSNVVKAATTVSYDNAGVLTLVTGAIQSKAADGTDDTALAADAYMTMAKDVKVMIVNRDRNEVYEGTTGSIAQYASYTGGHAFAWELDANGYISTLYILD